MSETEEPKRSKAGRKGTLPLPRLWKAETEPDEVESVPPKKSRKGSEPEPAKSTGKSKSPNSKAKPKPAKAKAAANDGDKADKKVLIEETPALDTIESRQRARLVMGGVITAC